VVSGRGDGGSVKALFDANPCFQSTDSSPLANSAIRCRTSGANTGQRSIRNCKSLSGRYASDSASPVSETTVCPDESAVCSGHTGPIWYLRSEKLEFLDSSSEPPAKILISQVHTFGALANARIKAIYESRLSQRFLGRECVKEFLPISMQKFCARRTPGNFTRISRAWPIFRKLIRNLGTSARLNLSNRVFVLRASGNPEPQNYCVQSIPKLKGSD
jgi:hypothetical protein